MEERNMEDILRPIYQERASSPSTLGILLVEKKDVKKEITDTFDFVLLVITESDEQLMHVKHYSYHDKKAVLYTFNKDLVQEWLLLGNSRRLTEWLHNGRIIFDRNDSISTLKEEVKEFPFYGRKLKKGLEFSKLIRRYTDGKVFFEQGQYLDAYNHIVHSLHHLARLEIIEKGFYPEVTVWDQVKYIGPQIYKLYEELITSEESLDKRLELLFLAIEFLIYSRTEIGVEHFVGVISSKEEPWTIDEMYNHPELKHYALDLPVMIEYLIEKEIVEVVKIKTKGNEVFHRLYQIK